MVTVQVSLYTTIIYYEVNVEQRLTIVGTLRTIFCTRPVASISLYTIHYNIIIITNRTL